MLSYKSDTFQTARKDLDELNKAFQQAGNKLGVDDVKNFLAEKNISFDEFKNANQEFVKAGKEYVVDIDLESFFDRVNHDLLMSKVAGRITDKRVLKLIRAYLNSGILTGGLVSSRQEGTPQGGPLSPLLSNILLDSLDKELEKRGHSFCRYADMQICR